MSVWSTKSLGRDRDYVLIKHPIRGINYSVKGIKFRDGYGVIEKGSKTYNDLMQIPMMRKCQEYDLLFLRKLKFITRTVDVKFVYGEDVYRFYLKKLNEALKQESKEAEVKKEEIHLQTNELCKYRTPSAALCQNPTLEISPSGHCRRHILQDPKLVDFGIAVPKFIPKKEVAEVRDRVIKQLEKAIKEHGKDRVEERTSEEQLVSYEQVSEEVQ